MIILSGCSIRKPSTRDNRTYAVYCRYEGINKFAVLECDSFQMETKNIIWIFVDGVKQKVIADQLAVETIKND